MLCLWLCDALLCIVFVIVLHVLRAIFWESWASFFMERYLFLDISSLYNCIRCCAVHRGIYCWIHLSKDIHFERSLCKSSCTSISWAYANGSTLKIKQEVDVMLYGEQEVHLIVKLMQALFIGDRGIYYKWEWDTIYYAVTHFRIHSHLILL